MTLKYELNELMAMCGFDVSPYYLLSKSQSNIHDGRRVRVAYLYQGRADCNDVFADNVDQGEGYTTTQEAIQYCVPNSWQP